MACDKFITCLSGVGVYFCPLLTPSPRLVTSACPFVPGVRQASFKFGVRFVRFVRVSSQSGVNYPPPERLQRVGCLQLWKLFRPIAAVIAMPVVAGVCMRVPTLTTVAATKLAILAALCLDEAQNVEFQGLQTGNCRRGQWFCSG